MNDTVKALIYLLSCAVNSVKADETKIRSVNIEELYDICKNLTLRATVYAALKSAGISSETFYLAYNKAVRKNVLLDIERTALLERFEAQGIWYMPLKGSLLKELYPENGMREMADNDILYDAEKQEEVRTIMLSARYTAENIGSDHHDVYMKPPVLNFEMHTKLFEPVHVRMYEYYCDTERLMLPDADKKYGYHLSDNDFYVYITAHEYKHYSGGGTGLRSLLDRYVYLSHKRDTLDWEYISVQLEKLNIADFERQSRQLTEKLFSSTVFPVLTEDEQEMLLEYLNYGTYGTTEHAAENKVKKYINDSEKHTKLGFVLNMLIPDMEFMKNYYPLFYRHKLLLPIGYIWRCIKGITTKQRKLKEEMKALIEYDSKKV